MRNFQNLNYACIGSCWLISASILQLGLPAQNKTTLQGSSRRRCGQARIQKPAVTWPSLRCRLKGRIAPRRPAQRPRASPHPLALIHPQDSPPSTHTWLRPLLGGKRTKAKHRCYGRRYQRSKNAATWWQFKLNEKKKKKRKKKDGQNPETKEGKTSTRKGSFCTPPPSHHLHLLRRPRHLCRASTRS